MANVIPRAIIASTSPSSSFRCIITGVSPHNNCSAINSFSLPYENVSFFTADDDRNYMVVMRCEKTIDIGYGDVNNWDISSEKCGGEEKQYYSYVVMNPLLQNKFCCGKHRRLMQNRDEVNGKKVG
ncbi:kinase R-like protein [Trifolium pratense]|uniref:Kinase R-like protein n=1 Tax=Trifolium pratense TaxID=57577 RepID=A0A2K3K3H2_TRIPR|nr:kinase R-like protein [Trifolium pratense]